MTTEHHDILPQLDNEKQSSALLRLLDQSLARKIIRTKPSDMGLAEHIPYPFMAMVGQLEMRIALILSIINPSIGGVLLIGPRGTGKTTAVRSLVDLLPNIEVSDCNEGILPIHLTHEKARVLYPDCFDKYERGETISHFERMKLVELPLNARLDDVVGGINERIATQQNKVRLERGILARADQNLLYVDEVNLLDDEITDAILDAAAMGSYTVRRGAMVGTYRSQFVLIGSMNPEEGRLRPQIMDRFGLRVNVRGVTDFSERMEIYRRVQNYKEDPSNFVRSWNKTTTDARDDILKAREKLPNIGLTKEAERFGLTLVQALEIDSHRAEYALFEAARAYAASDNRDEAVIDDLRFVAPLALRERKSDFMSRYFQQAREEDIQIKQQLDKIQSELS